MESVQILVEARPEAEAPAKEKIRKRCSIEGCEKFISRRGLCWKHGGTFIQPRCQITGCEKTVHKSGLCCAHGAILPRCRFPECSKQARTGGFCMVHHPNHVNPGVKEARTREYLNSLWPGQWIHNRIVAKTCRRIIDHQMRLDKVIVAVETDQDGHVYYDKTDEVARMQELAFAAELPIVFIRFNPDGHSEVPLQAKLERLGEEVTHQIEVSEISGLQPKAYEVVKLFY